LFPVTFPSEIDSPRLLPLWGFPVVEDNTESFVHVGLPVFPVSPSSAVSLTPSDMKNLVFRFLGESTESVDLFGISIAVMVTLNSFDSEANELLNESVLFPVPSENLFPLNSEHLLDSWVLPSFSVILGFQAVMGNFEHKADSFANIVVREGVVELGNVEGKRFVHENSGKVC
jgi:hypothetical protein